MKHSSFASLALAAGLVFLASPLPGQIVTSVTDLNSDAAIANGVTSQRENALAGTIVPFGEDAFAFTDRTHQYNGARFDTNGVLTTAETGTETVIGLPSYLLGGEYISTRNNNRDNATFSLSVTVNQPVRAYLLLDNRLGDSVNTTPPTLGASGTTNLMAWVADQGWTIMNTGISPNGQADFGAIDEGGSITDFTLRSTTPANLGVGPGSLINNFWSVFTKDFGAGTFTLLEQNGGGINMYGLVVQPIPEPGLLTLLVLGLGFFFMRRRS